MRALLASMQLLEQTVAWSVSLGRATATGMRRRHVQVVRVVGTQVLDLRAVICVQLVRLTRTLMPRLRALCAHRATTAAPARRRALLVRLGSMTMTRMRAQRVYPAVLVTSLPRRR